jgi:hypothetical protein
LQQSPNGAATIQMTPQNPQPPPSSTQSAPSVRSAPSVDAREGEDSTVPDGNAASDGAPETANASETSNTDTPMMMSDPNSGFAMGRSVFGKDDSTLKLWESGSGNLETNDFWNGIPLTFSVDDLTLDSMMGEGGPTSPTDATPPPATPEALAALDVHPHVDGLPPWAVLPQHVAPQYQIDHVIAAVTRNRRMHQAESGNKIEFSSTTYPSIASLLNPSTERASKYPVSSTLAKHAPWMSVPSLPEKLAVMYGICNIVRVRSLSPSNHLVQTSD